ncbi:MAG: M15 family metallopeptidase [Candidatus Paceibacterota bacterium]
MEPTTSHKSTIIIAIIATFVVAGVGYAGYWGYQKYSTLEQAKNSLQAELEKTKREYASTTEQLQNDLGVAKEYIVSTQTARVNAEQDVQKGQEALDAMAKTLGIYEKLTQTDRELLAKYSKVYFLSDTYSPKLSVTIPPSYTLETQTEKYFLSEAWPFLQSMLGDATKENIDLKILSAFRSFDTQTKLKNAYTVTYGSGANKFSADQGYSEHQLGTAIDFTTSKLGTKYTTFEKTASYTWLAANAYKYGFVLSYPKNNLYYIFEPWHWRFVGKALALRLHNENKNFVDLPQRDINDFLIYIFDGNPVIN